MLSEKFGFFSKFFRYFHIGFSRRNLVCILIYFICVIARRSTDDNLVILQDDVHVLWADGIKNLAVTMENIYFVMCRAT